jgi:hypothetical protein
MSVARKRPIYLGSFDFRIYGPTIFHVFRELCFLSKSTVADSLAIFNKNELVSPTLISKVELVERAQTFMNDFKTQTPSSFQRTLQLSRDTTHGNQLLTGAFTNGRINCYADTNSNNGQFSAEIWWVNSLNPTCNCGTSPTSCKISLEVYCAHTAERGQVGCFTIPNQIFPGFYLCCEPFDGLLESTLECAYTDICLAQIFLSLTLVSNASLQTSTGQNVTSVNVTTNSRFPVTTKILEIVNELMIEQWIEDVSFQSYFEQCHPTVCVYTLTQRFDLITTIVSVIGIAAGLSVVLRILAPMVVKLIRKMKQQHAPTARNAWIRTGRCILQ